ncbi:MAG: energy-coupled thiamine transporter ThiT [Eubacterium sp.]|nr:energy-coupled thiamine transporter ThiT [Eubacterium sp.]
MFDNLQGFFESTTGQITTVVVIAIMFFLILILGGKDNKYNVKGLTISAVLVAMAMILSNIKLFEMPQGGSVTAFSMLPIVLVGYLLGPRQGILAGFALGLLNLIFGPYVIHPIQLLIDYPFAFGALGLSGFCRNMDHGLIKGYLLGIFGRYVMAVLSGVIFFGEYAPEGFSALTWSLWYNLTYLAAEGAITIIILCIPAVRKALERLKTI